MSERIHHIPRERGVTLVALMRGDEELSSTLIVPMTIRVGRAVLRMDGIGGVATPEEHRHRGYSRHVLENAVETMKAGDAVLSTLYGIPDFYPKYGYATVGPETYISLSATEASPGSGHTFRVATPGDLVALQRLYRADTDGATGALVREDDWRAWSELAEALAAGEVHVLTRDDRPVAYAWPATHAWWMEQWEGYTPGGLKIGEAQAADPDAADALLAALRGWAYDTGQETVQLAIPQSGRVGAAATLQDAEVLQRRRHTAEFMGRSTGTVALLRALRPELEARWRTVSASLPPFAIVIDTGEDLATLTGNDRGIGVASGAAGDIETQLTPGDLARLVLGGFDPDRLLERLIVPAAAAPLLATLFPRRDPWIHPVDRF